jgi:hypothetical protein
MIRRSLYRALADLEAERRARAAPPPPAGLDAAGMALWRQWARDMEAEADPHARKVKRIALLETSAELVGLAVRARR